MASTILKATQNAWPAEGPPIKKGRTYASDAPQLAGLSKEQVDAWFVPFAPDFPAREAPIEQATKAPGEKRTTRPKKSE